MPAKLERCVDRLLKDKKFQPNVNAEKRKSSAYAICTAATQRNCEFMDMVLDLPPYISFDIRDDGSIELSEVEDFDFEAYDEQEEVSALDEDSTEFTIHFSEKQSESDKFRAFSAIQLQEATKVKKPKKMRKDDDEDEYEERLRVPMEMLREGTFRHPYLGDLEINRKMFIKMMENFMNDILERDIALDVSHNPDDGAYGWLSKLGLRRRDFKDKKKRNVLMGHWDMNPRGERTLEEDIFRYFSIEYSRDYRAREKTEAEIAEDKKKTPEQREKERWEGKDRGVSFGPTIFGGALTNRPFITGMKSVKMSEDVSPDEDGEPTGIASDPQQTTDGDGDVEAKTTGKGGKAKDGKKAGSCKSEEDEDTEKRDNEKEIIENAAAETKARPPDSKLPDAAFALVKRDRSGKVTKRSLPHHGPGVKSPTENTSVDKGRLRNALARWNQVEGFSADEKARARGHLQRHAAVLLPSYKKTKASEGGTMFEDRIAELKDQLDGMEDKTTELALKVKDEIAFLEKATADHEAKLNETKSQISDEMTAKLSEQQALIDKLTERDKAREVKLAEITEKNRRTEIEMYCDGLGQKKIAPAVIKAARNLLLGEIQDRTTEDGDALVKFSEDIDGKKNENKFSFRDAVEYLVASIPATSAGEAASIEHNEDDTPDTADGGEGKVQLSDGSEKDIMDEAAIEASIKKAGYKTKAVQ